MDEAEKITIDILCVRLIKAQTKKVNRMKK
jgi:hypothetical protein